MKPTVGKKIKRALATLNFDLFRKETLTPPAPATLHSKILDDARRPVEIPAEAAVPVSSELPSEAELSRRFDIYNWQYYQGKLAKPRIEYSTRMKAAGSYSPSENLIKIGRPYHEIFPEELNQTLKHEMIHIIHLKHNSAFKKEAERIGTTVRAKFHPDLMRPPKYVYACPGCGKQYPRQKRLVMASCGYCSPKGKFDGRFKLTLIDAKTSQRMQ